MAYKVLIDKPCKESWNAMRSSENGRFCNKCKVEVVDFSNFNEVDISNYFIASEHIKVCGYFHKAQLTPIGSGLKGVLLRMAHRNYLKNDRDFKFYLNLVLLSMALVLFGCRVNTIKGDVSAPAPPKIDSTSNIKE